jgi:adsorption protein B
MLIANGALMIWRLGLRSLIVAHYYGWREGIRSVPRAFIANLISMVAARQALMRYIRMLRGHAPVWDKTRHIYPDTLPAE